jgi:hypothetical protein
MCPFKPVVQREQVVVEIPHEHQFLAQIDLGNGIWVQDCTCGHRQRARKGAHGEVVEVLSDGMVVDGSSLDNVVFLKNAEGHFVNRWDLYS